VEEKQDIIRQMILNGEGPRIEFKGRFTTAIDREMAALANAGGGSILIGVADDSAVTGLVESPQRLEERIMGLCRTNIQPSLTPAIEITPLSEGTVIEIQVPEGQQKPYTANGICYVRAGPTTRHARPEELRSLSFETEYTRFERTIGFAFEDLNLARLRDCVERRAPDSTHIRGGLPGGSCGPLGAQFLSCGRACVG